MIEIRWIFDACLGADLGYSKICEDEKFNAVGQPKREQKLADREAKCHS